ncbi:MAG: CoA transferase [Dehalococcoidia bacterium]
MKLPLEGIRVLEITVVWAGPYGTQLLADWGAEVIRVESTQFVAPNTRSIVMRPSPERFKFTLDMGYGYAGLYPDSRAWNKSPLFNTHARNKMGMTMDLQTPEGLRIFKELLSLSDIFIENNMPDTMDKLGLGYEELRKTRGDLIMIRMPAFGLEGRYRGFRSWGMHVEAVAGHVWVKGYPDADPSGRPESNLADSAAGLSASLAAVMALRHRNRTGEGQLVEVPLCENFIPYLGESVLSYSMNGRVQGTLGNGHPSMAPHGCYPCNGDDRWVVISVASDREWQGLCRAMGNPQWTRDDKYCTVLGRWNHQGEIDERVGRWTRGLDHYQVTRLLQDEGVAAAPVMDERDAYNDPHIRERGFFQELYDPEAGTHCHVGFMWRMTSTPNRLRRPPCHLGFDNEYLYKELLGVGSQEYSRLEAEGHIGTEPAPHIP